MFLAPALTLLAALPVVAASNSVSPLPANTRALANDVASRSTAEQKAWAAEVARRRPMPGYEALKAEVRSRFATHRRMSELEIDRLAFLGVVSGFDSGTAELARQPGVGARSERRTTVFMTATPTPSASRLVRSKGSAAGTGVLAGNSLTKDSELSMIELQSLVAQRQLAIRMTTSLLGALDTSNRTIAAKIGR